MSNIFKKVIGQDPNDPGRPAPSVTVGIRAPEPLAPPPGVLPPPAQAQQPVSRPPTEAAPNNPPTGGKHHHHSHSEDGRPAPAQQLPMMMAALHDLAQQHAQQAADAQQAQRGHHGAPRHGNRDQLLPGVATPFEFIAQERAQGFTDRWTELQAAQHPGG